MYTTTLCKTLYNDILTYAFNMSRIGSAASLHSLTPIEVVAAIDQGTQSTRVFLFDKEFQPVASHQIPFSQIYPQAGCVDHATAQQSRVLQGFE